MEKVYRRKGCQEGQRLESQHRNGGPRSARKPPDCEESYHRQLTRDEELPEMSSSTFVSLASDAKESNRDENQSESRAGHC
jgi:hypothetical protein